MSKFKNITTCPGASFDCFNFSYAKHIGTKNTKLLTGVDTIVDLYGGIGSLTLGLASSCPNLKTILFRETNPTRVQCYKKNLSKWNPKLVTGEIPSGKGVLVIYDPPWNNISPLPKLETGSMVFYNLPYHLQCRNSLSSDTLVTPKQSIGLWIL